MDFNKMRKPFLVYLLLVLTKNVCDVLAADDEFVPASRLVCITQGCLEGTTIPGYQVDAYEAFLGIPFAQPPVGRLRFAVSLELSDLLRLQSFANIVRRAQRIICGTESENRTCEN